MAGSATSQGSSLPHLPELCALPTSEESVWGMISRGDIEEWSWRASRKISPERMYLNELGGHFDDVVSKPWTYRLGDYDVSIVRTPRNPRPSATSVRRSVKSEIEIRRSRLSVQQWLGGDYDRLLFWLHRGGQISSSGAKRKRPTADYQSWVRSATVQRAVHARRQSRCHGNNPRRYRV